MEASTEIFSSIEVLPVRGGRRRWPDELKARIVAETLEAGATVAGGCVETRSECQPTVGLASSGPGRSVGSAAADTEVEFAPLLVRAEWSCDPGPSGERLEVVVDRVTVRLDAATLAGRITEIVSALNVSA